MSDRWEPTKPGVHGTGMARRQVILTRPRLAAIADLGVRGEDRAGPPPDPMASARGARGSSGLTSSL